MKIALINENSQAAKNGIIEAALKKVVEPVDAYTFAHVNDGNAVYDTKHEEV